MDSVVGGMQCHIIDFYQKKMSYFKLEYFSLSIFWVDILWRIFIFNMVVHKFVKTILAGRREQVRVPRLLPSTTLQPIEHSTFQIFWRDKGIKHDLSSYRSLHAGGTSWSNASSTEPRKTTQTSVSLWNSKSRRSSEEALKSDERERRTPTMKPWSSSPMRCGIVKGTKWSKSDDTQHENLRKEVWTP